MLAVSHCVDVWLRIVLLCGDGDDVDWCASAAALARTCRDAATAMRGSVACWLQGERRRRVARFDAEYDACIVRIARAYAERVICEDIVAPPTLMIENAYRLNCGTYRSIGTLCVVPANSAVLSRSFTDALSGAIQLRKDDCVARLWHMLGANARLDCAPPIIHGQCWRVTCYQSSSYSAVDHIARGMEQAIGAIVRVALDWTLPSRATSPTWRSERLLRARRIEQAH